MKKITKILFVLCLVIATTSTSYAQSENCQFVFKGTLAGKTVTMCFMPDNNDGKVYGEYYYGNGKNGVMNFKGTATQQADGSFRQRLEESNAQGTVTGYFTGTLKKGVMTGTWTSTDGTRSFKYSLILQK